MQSRETNIDDSEGSVFIIFPWEALLVNTVWRIVGLMLLSVVC